MALAGLGSAAALVLAGLFALSALAKLVDRDGTARAFAQLGVPSPRSAARLLPLPELAAAVLLVVAPVAGALVVLVLLALFTTFVVGRLRAGVQAPCACFGGAGSSPLSWLTVARNLGMAALAVVALAATRPPRPSWAALALVAGATAAGAVALAVAGRLARR